MNVGILKDGVCVDANVFTDYATAQQFFDDGVWSDADAIAELPDGYGIGDSCDGATWTKAVQSEPTASTPEEQQLRYVQLVQQYIHEKYTVDDEIALTNAAVEVLASGGDMPEEYAAYRTYVEECKERARKDIYG